MYIYACFSQLEIEETFIAQMGFRKVYLTVGHLEILCPGICAVFQSMSVIIIILLEKLGKIIFPKWKKVHLVFTVQPCIRGLKSNSEITITRHFFIHHSNEQ